MHRFFSFLAARLAAAAALLPATMAMAGGGLLCGTAADELVAARAGLVREWVVQIPFDSAGWSLEHVSIGDGLVVATSGDGGVHAVSTSSGTGQPRPGSVIWSRRIGRPGGAGQPAGIGGDLVTVATISTSMPCIGPTAATPGAVRSAARRPVAPCRRATGHTPRCPATA